MKRRLSIAEETVRIKKERLADAEQECDDEICRFTIFSQRLERKWEERFNALVRLTFVGVSELIVNFGLLLLDECFCTARALSYEVFHICDSLQFN